MQGMWGNWHLVIHMTGDTALWITGIATALTAGILLATGLIIRRQLREAEKTRFATLISDLTRRWDEPLLQAARLELSHLDPTELLQIVQRSYERPRGPEDAIFLRLQALPNFFEYLGVLEADTKGVPIDLLNVLWRSAILTTWRRWEPTIEWIRDGAGTRTPYARFQLLADRIRQMPEPRVVSEAEGSAPQAMDPAERQTTRSSQAPSSSSSTPTTSRTSSIGTSHSNGQTPTKVIGVIGGLLGLSALWVIRQLLRRSR